MSGWVKIHRSIQDNPLWTAEPFTRGQAWIDLLIMANHKNHTVFVRGIPIEVKRGQVGRSILFISDRWKWSRSKVVNFLNYLKNEQQIEHQITNVSTLITILNYDKYQSDEQQNEQQNDNRTTTEIQQKDNRTTHTRMNKNDKKKEECKEYISEPKAEEETVLLKIAKDERSTKVSMTVVEAKKLEAYFTEKLDDDVLAARREMMHLAGELENHILNNPKKKPASNYLTLRNWFNRNLKRQQQRKEEQYARQQITTK
jgi:DNA replication protein DnaD